MARGQAPSLDVPVRAHLFLACGLLLAAGVLALARPAVPLAPDAPLLLALVGGTLFLSGVAYWYLPSFAKRAVTPPLLSRAAPWLAGLAALALLGEAALLHFAEVRGGASLRAFVLLRTAASNGAALLLLSFAFTLVLSVARGPPWRGGTPFWRKAGPFQAGDRLALASFAASVAWLVVAAGFLAASPLRPLTPSGLLAWLAALLLFLAGAFAHLLPRARGAPLRPWGVGLGLALLNAAFLLLAAPRAPSFSPVLLAAALLLLVPALALPRGGRGKTAGPRLRQAAPHLLAASTVLLGGAAALAATLRAPAAAPLAYAGLLAGPLLATMALSLLTLPVLFNQRPAGAFVLPSAAAGLLGFLALALGLALPPLRQTALPALSASLLLWLAALWPLRRPRRECPPDEAEPS